ncbi:MAG: hypothetical protein ACLGI9_18140, partial [Thermoanaerobaculia bacterium]
MPAPAQEVDLTREPIPKAVPAAAEPVQEIGPQVRVDKGGASFSIETAALTTEADPSEVFAAWYDTRQIPGTPATLTRLALATSRDGGRTWTESLVDLPDELRSNIAADPMFAHDSRTGTTWVGGVSLGTNPNVFILRKDRGTAGFGPPVKVLKDRRIDKPWMAAGIDPSDASRTRLYVVHNLGLQISADLGDTWSAPTPLGNF